MSDWNGGLPKRYDLSILTFVLPSHLEERWLERIGEPYDRERVRQEVFGAVIRGRFSGEKPGWLESEPSFIDDLYFYAWTPDRRYAYVVRWDGPHFVVRTVLVPAVPEPAKWRKQLSRWLQQGEEPA